MSRQQISLLVILFVIIISGCQGSPILNHKNASHDNLNNDKLSGDCPISFTSIELCGSWSWQKWQLEDDPGSAELHVWHLQSPLAPLSIELFPEVILWMPSMGHGSSEVTITPKRNEKGEPLPGYFLATDIFFIMGGSWEIQINLYDQNHKRQDQSAFLIQVTL